MICYVWAVTLLQWMTVNQVCCIFMYFWAFQDSLLWYVSQCLPYFILLRTTILQQHHVQLSLLNDLTGWTVFLQSLYSSFPKDATVFFLISVYVQLGIGILKKLYFIIMWTCDGTTTQNTLIISYLLTSLFHFVNSVAKTCCQWFWCYWNQERNKPINCGKET